MEIKIRECFGTKEFCETSHICKRCPDFIECGYAIEKEMIYNEKI